MTRWLLILAVLLTACSPLKRVQRSEKIDSVVVDKSVTEQHTENTYKGEGTLVQTVIEFYRPMESELSLDKPKMPVAANPSKQPVKRIVVTKIEAKAEAKELRDSTVRNDIHTTVEQNTAEKVVEKPPVAVAWIKWAAIALGVILLIIIVIKI